ncbi:MAG: DUF885 domain-containing protein [Acidobacteria bacterium]|nr:DUF885 domain-containing protein [Acidobacteriota bacterium]
MIRIIAVCVCGLLLVAGTVSSCKTTSPEVNQKREKLEMVNDRSDKTFEGLANEFIDELLEMNPEWATNLGDHQYDSQLSDYSAEGIENALAFNKKYLNELERISPDKLSKENNIDYRILKHNLESAIFQIETLKEYEWNPLSYNPGSAINNLISRDFAPLKDRLENVKARLEGIPAVLEAAKKNLKNPPKIYTETAIAQNKGVIGLINGELQRFVDEAKLTKEFAPVQKKTIEALEDYGKWLETDLLPRSDGDFRLGDEKFRKKLKFSLDSDMTKEEVLKRAEADLVATQDRMHKIALPLFKKYFPDETDVKKLGDKKIVIKAVLDKLAEDRPDNDTIVKLAQEDVAKTTEFVRQKDLVTVPDEPLEVIEMPEFARGTAVAYFDSAGPFEKKNETFYAIAPTPKDWDQKRVDSFYREYNDYMVQNLTIHEAMPGHYLQIMHSNKFKAPTKIRAIFGSGSFVEGWAVYSEQLMAENGYGGPEVEMQQLKMKLRVIINAIIDQKIHTANMSEKEAMDFMMNEGFQEEGEAAGKWKRANLSSTQLSTYYIGSVEVNDIAKAFKEKNPQTPVREMHDKMLSFGSPAAKYVKEMLDLN